MLGTVIIMYNLEDQLSCDSLARVDHPFCASVLNTFFDLLRSAQSLILKSWDNQAKQLNHSTELAV